MAPFYGLFRSEMDAQGLNRTSENEEAPGKLTPRQHRAIAEIMASPSLEEARRRLGAGKDTLYGWLRDPVFSAELKRQLDELARYAMDRLKVGLSKSVDKLLEVVDRSDVEVSLQIRAAQTLLEHGIRVVEIQELEQRIANLEETIKNQRGTA